MANHILPLISSSENNLKSNPSIQTVSKALLTSRKQLNTSVPHSSMWLNVSNIVTEASIQCSVCCMFPYIEYDLISRSAESLAGFL